jgi:hypothetical protein
VKDNKKVRDIDIHKLQQTLLNANAYIMPLYDVNPADKEFQAIQRVTASGLLKVKGEPFDWANRTWFYPDTTISVKEFSEGLNAFDNKTEILHNPSLLSTEKAINILSVYVKRDIAHEVQNLWNKTMKRKWNANLNITKRELSVLIDEFVRPFEAKSIDFDGNYH